MKYYFLSFKYIATGCHRRKAEPLLLFILLWLRCQIQTAADPGNKAISEFLQPLIRHTAILETATCIPKGMYPFMENVKSDSQMKETYSGFLQQARDFHFA